jgi:phosphohistidine phosphatase SixA
MPAVRWATMLGSAGIEHVYTSTARRTIETGGIIAEALDVDAEAVETGDTAGLLDLMSFDFEDTRVLVVGHVETIPGIIRELGSAETPEMTQEEFGRMFVVMPAEGSASLIELVMP